MAFRDYFNEPVFLHRDSRTLHPMIFSFSEKLSLAGRGNENHSLGRTTSTSHHSCPWRLAIEPALPPKMKQARQTPKTESSVSLQLWVCLQSRPQQLRQVRGSSFPQTTMDAPTLTLLCAPLTVLQPTALVYWQQQRPATAYMGPTSVLQRTTNTLRH